MKKLFLHMTNGETIAVSAPELLAYENDCNILGKMQRWINDKPEYFGTVKYDWNGNGYDKNKVIVAKKNIAYMTIGELQ